MQSFGIGFCVAGDREGIRGIVDVCDDNGGDEGDDEEKEKEERGIGEVEKGQLLKPGRETAEQ